MESSDIKIAGLICKNFSYEYSRVDAHGSLENFFEANDLFAISDVDTRALVSYIRENCAMNAVISTDIENIEALKKQLAEVPNMEGVELASKVSTKEPYYFQKDRIEQRLMNIDLISQLQNQLIQGLKLVFFLQRLRPQINQQY